MATRKHIHEEEFPVSAAELFKILHTPSAIGEWWGTSQAIVIPEPGGLWAATWGGSQDEPDYVSSATITHFDPPRRLVLADYRYRARTGALPFDANFVTEFLVESSEGGATLKVTQDGFPGEAAADEFYEGCRVGWAATFDGIRRFLAAD